MSNSIIAGTSGHSCIVRTCCLKQSQSGRYHQPEITDSARLLIVRGAYYNGLRPNV